ncbi:CBS domain-containing protein [Halorientalis brevis]|uniref:Zinc metalloprotease n=1 Tax=Halorientalis brevis TaxID=1126241 RepID=A0ABD6C7V9_9EURY|nr:CBS domain-containing protein [Halorientalis brevis]
MQSFRIGKLFGIPIKLDLTFLLVLPLFAWIISAQVGEWVGILNDVWGAAIPADAFTAPETTIVLGIVAAVGLFVGVVLHELGHSLVAMRFGYPIDSITLWLFGGVAQLTEMPEDWKQELAIAIAGPIVSVGLGVGSYVAFTQTPTSLPAAKFLLGYLALMNVALAGFNLLPGFPMDGGRVLRALLASRIPYAKATQWAAEVGKFFAILLGLFGLFGGGGLFMVAIAFFIYIGASGEAQQTVMRAAFEGVTVSDIMTPATQVQTVAPGTSVAELLEQMFRERHTGYPVVQGGEIVGLVALDDALEVKEIERDAYRVEEIMTTDLKTVSPDADVMDALTQLQQNSVGRLLVMDGEDLVGIITRSDIMTALSIIKQSGAYRGQPDEGDESTEPSASQPESRF